MAQVINTNYSSLNAQRNLVGSQNGLEKTLQRLSTGLRINSAKDDAAGLGITERMTAQIRGLDQATRNANDGISLAQTAESALSSTGEILQRMRELAVQSANATNSDTDRKALQDEMNQLNSELDRFASNTEFNGKKLFDGTFGSVKFQIGANANQTISVSNANMRTNAYGNNYVVGAGASGAAASGATQAVSNGVVSGYINIQGYRGSIATATGITSGVAVASGSSAQTIANTINTYTNDTGVTATARTELEMKFAAAGTYSLNLTSENTTAQSVTFTLSANATSDGLSSAVSAINDQSAKTGITATLNSTGTGVLLANALGKDIKVDEATADSIAGNVTIAKAVRSGTGALVVDTTLVTLTAGDGTANYSVTSGYLQLDSSSGFSVRTDATFNALTAAATTTNSSMNKVSDLDIQTFDKATQAIKTIDAAISKVASQRSNLGAIQSRFEYTVSNLMTSSENLSASRSRIRDADFAAETANMTKLQILQQAGISVLSQANQGPQNTLSLLR